MPNKSDIKAVGAVVIGVLVAGIVMYNFRDIGLIGQARAGYDV